MELGTTALKSAFAAKRAWTKSIFCGAKSIKKKKHSTPPESILPRSELKSSGDPRGLTRFTSETGIAQTSPIF